MNLVRREENMDACSQTSRDQKQRSQQTFLLFIFFSASWNKRNWISAMIPVIRCVQKRWRWSEKAIDAQKMCFIGSSCEITVVQSIGGALFCSVSFGILLMFRFTKSIAFSKISFANRFTNTTSSCSRIWSDSGKKKQAAIIRRKERSHDCNLGNSRHFSLIVYFLLFFNDIGY